VEFIASGNKLHNDVYAICAMRFEYCMCSVHSKLMTVVYIYITSAYRGRILQYTGLLQDKKIFGIDGRFDLPEQNIDSIVRI